MDFKILKTKKDYENALKRLEKVFDAKPGSKESNELELLAMLIERYEKEHFPIDAPDPVEAIKFRMEQLGMKQKDLDKIIGGKNRVSEILNRKRKLSLEMIRNIHASLDIPLESLIQAY
ncbi:MAG TPA: transcriptional regulator [Flavobacteriales bacterium]|nr:transcriptional regulator [Flavobacteriales bacterium]HRE74641.1 helix-turn-helix domain-containing protein [Flavobacteriales bacterium]HRJ38804.1 helix-turn-helix domain-containing protein [Flavobacteriales bacterium]